MPATIMHGKLATFTFTEWSGKGGTGTKVPPVANLIYSTSNPVIASVNQAGTVTGLKKGICTISARDPGDGLTASDTLTVK